MFSQLDPNTLHFFDESSVIKTTENSKYDDANKGFPAIEWQPYASNATYPINLLHSIRGIDAYDILAGLYNGVELLVF